MKPARRYFWRIAAVALIAGGIVLLRIYEHNYQKAAMRREQTADTTSKPIEIAVVWPRSKNGADSFIRGVNLAVSQINQAGGVTTLVQLANGEPQPQQRNLHVRFFDEQDTDTGVGIARYLATQSNVMAVVGHKLSAIPASIVYNASGLLFIAPTNLDPELTRHDFANVFSIAPHVEQVALSMVEEIEKIIVKTEVRLAVLYPQEMQNPDFTTRLNRASERVNPKRKVNFKVFPSLAYPKPSLLRTLDEDKQVEFSNNLRRFVEKSDDYDIVLIADVAPDAPLIRARLEGEFQSQANANDKTILDLAELNWSRVQDFYADFSSGNSDELDDQIVRLVLDASRQNVAIVASRDVYGETLGATIWSSIYDRMDDPANRLGLELYRSYFPDPSRSSTMLIASEIMAANPAAVFIAANDKQAVELIRQLRPEYSQPVMCAPGLAPELRQATSAERSDGKMKGSGSNKTLSQNAEYAEREDLGRTFAVSPFNPDRPGAHPSKAVEDFVGSFQRGFNATPDWLAAAGYFSMKLFAFAFERGKSASPQTAAASLLLYRKDDDILGKSSFSQTTRDLQGLTMYLKSFGKTYENSAEEK